MALNSLLFPLRTRYKMVGPVDDINQAVALGRAALSLCPQRRPDRHAFLIKLSTYLSARHNALGGVDDLTESIDLAWDALSRCPPGHRHRAVALNTLAFSLCARFEHLGEIGDLDKAITLTRDALLLYSSVHVHRAMTLKNLASYLCARYNQLRRLDDLNEAITLARDSLSLFPPGHPDRSESLDVVASYLLDRYSHLGGPGDLDEVVVLFRDILSLCPPGHSDRPVSLNNLAWSLYTRFERVGKLDDLSEAITLARSTLSACPQEDPDRLTYLDRLLTSLHARFKQLGELDDLNEAIILIAEALSSCPRGHADRPALLNKYSLSLRARYERLGEISDLNKAILLAKEALSLCPQGHLDMLTLLNNVTLSLLARHKQLGRLGDLNEIIDLARSALSLCSTEHLIWHTLAYSLYSRFKQMGRLDDLNEAINLAEQVLLGHPQAMSLASYLLTYFKELKELDSLDSIISLDMDILLHCPIGHQFHPIALGSLALSLYACYCKQGNFSNLKRAIELQDNCLDLCPSDHQLHARALDSLALFLNACYHEQHNSADLHKALEIQERCLDLCPPGHQLYTTVLNNIALSLNTQYHLMGNLVDLQRAIDLQEICLNLCPPKLPMHGLALQNLALSLLDLYVASEDHSKLTRAIKLLKDALAVYPIQHSSFASNAAQLAQATLLSLQSLNSDQSTLDDAFEAYKQLKRCNPAVSLALLGATQSWVKDAEKHNHSSVLEAYQTSLNTLDHFISLNSSLDSRHEAMQRKVMDLASDAFSCAIRCGELKLAVELLEQGRGILWSQLACLDISIAALESQGSRGQKLGKKFAQLSADLREHALGHEGTAPYWQCLVEWRSVVDEIRRLEGFSRFLLPPRFDDLQQAAECGPVIIVNASEYSCDAVIVLRAHPPIHIPLPCSLADIDQLCVQLSELTQDLHAYRGHRELYVKEMLRDLWSSTVEPIVAVLRDDIQLPPGSRIWWCPTSKLTVLPFHAAGPHRKGSKNLMDVYISSYTPSLSALIRTRDRIRSQKRARETTGTMNLISFVAVGQAGPSADTHLGLLPEVEHEIQRIRNETEMPAEVEFDVVSSDAATIEGAVQAFQDHRWVHVACHGAQDAEKPFESWFAMGDGKLTLMRIIRERFTSSEFAFLSAEHTALGDASTPNEALNLAAGMQFAGFHGVVGTLWRVDDAVAHQVVTRFYREMFHRPIIDFEHAAAALNTAVLESADEVSLEKRIVFVHIGI